MKRILIFSVLLVFSILSDPARLAGQNCQDISGMDSLDINNVVAQIHSSGQLWAGVYRVPASDSTHLMHSGALWLGGYDSGGQLRFAAQTYRQSGTDFFSGPLDNAGNPLPNGCTDYDRVWKVNRADIVTLQQAAQSGLPVPFFYISQGILEWPALGNPYARGAHNTPLSITQNLAPFVDVNGDGIYDPTQGDYPEIPGDQAIFWVFNDLADYHHQSRSEPVGIEVHAFAYAYQDTGFLNDQTFYRYTVFNKGNHYQTDKFTFHALSFTNS